MVEAAAPVVRLSSTLARAKREQAAISRFSQAWEKALSAAPSRLRQGLETREAN